MAKFRRKIAEELLLQQLRWRPPRRGECALNRQLSIRTEFGGNGRSDWRSIFPSRSGEFGFVRPGQAHRDAVEFHLFYVNRRIANFTDGRIQTVVSQNTWRGDAWPLWFSSVNYRNVEDNEIVGNNRYCVRVIFRSTLKRYYYFIIFFRFLRHPRFTPYYYVLRDDRVEKKKNTVLFRTKVKIFSNISTMDNARGERTVLV